MAGLAVWFVVTSAIASTLMAGHWVTLPVPATTDARVIDGLNALRNRDGWMMVHVLYASCACSRRVFDHLLDSERPSDLEEVVLLVGDHDEFERAAPAAGYRVKKIASKDLWQSYGIESAPLLAVLDPHRAVRYLGGYTERKQGPQIQDLEVVHRLRADAEISVLPAFGCGVSAQLQRLLDPLKLKYRAAD